MTHLHLDHLHPTYFSPLTLFSVVPPCTENCRFPFTCLRGNLVLSMDITEEVTCDGHGHHVGGDRLDFLEYNNLFLDYPKIGRDNEGRIEFLHVSENKNKR
jgi:hypothetical protein